MTRARTVLFSVFAVFVLWFVVSVGSALRADTGESASGKLAAWARNHRLGTLVDWAESMRYSEPPSTAPAADLALVPEAAEPTTPATTIPRYTPEPLNPVLSPALEAEGEWRVVREVKGAPAVWVTGLRPSKKFGSVRATFALIDQASLRAVLFNGTEVPGGSNWENGAKVPNELSESLVFAFNGGFRREHARGGYFTEGREVWPLVRERATLAIDSDGRVHIGTWGRDIDPAGFEGTPWVSARQNLTLIVKGGEVAKDVSSIQWGASAKGELFILRSAVCVRTDGKLLYSIIGAADAKILARALINAGCETAMQLDVNASYPRAYHFNAGTPSRLDARMAGRDDLYLTKSHREFVAFFDQP
jgi:hypothetical protein